jgi:hypothetical protein
MRIDPERIEVHAELPASEGYDICASVIGEASLEDMERTRLTEHDRLWWENWLTDRSMDEHRPRGFEFL